MPSCTFACRRAVQRKLPPSSDTIWISDDALHHAFQRFALHSTTTKRHGSFVPGPLEARRRLGKRRMAYASEPTPTSPFTFGSLWNIFGGEDRTSFQWEAPTTRSPTPEASVDVPVSRLPRSTVQSPPTAAMYELESNTKPSQKPPTDLGLAANLSRFRRGIRRQGSTVHVNNCCQKFNKRLRRNFRQGEVSDTTLQVIVGPAVTNELRAVLADPMLSEQHRLALYQTVWNGMSTSKTIQLADFDGVILDELLCRLSELTITPEVYTMASSIIRSASIAQHNRMGDGLHQLIYAWAESWLDNQDPTDAELCSVDAVTAANAVTRADHRLLDLDSSIAALHGCPTTNVDFAEARKDIQKARVDILRGINAFGEAKYSIFSSTERSARTLTETLATITKDEDVLWSIIKPCSDGIAKLLKDTPKESTSKLRYHWLSLVVDITPKHENNFVSAWQILESSGSPLDESLAGSIILRYWINRGVIKHPSISERTWKAKPICHRTLSGLIGLLDSYQELSWFNVYELVTVLLRLDNHTLIPRVLRSVQRCRLQLPGPVMGKILRKLAPQNARAAYDVFRLWGASARDVRLTRCGPFIFSLIQDTKFSPDLIWDMLRISDYGNVPFYEWPGFSNDPHDGLSPAMNGLIRDMAYAFAQSKFLAPRTALRNVERCFLYLRIRGESITPDMTRAICHAALTRELLKHGRVSQERLEWAISWIYQVEGKQVAEAVDTLVYHWRMYHIQTAQRIERRQRSLEGDFHFGIIG
ncbi:uncharacterized protein BP5553_07768 [Venustampulla echinocandica]|uniref:Uncharacterized protein n=1 Tax=Venustampulla echinocandica TaxID=2656787 RepID=A0A370THI2_9HELO|nr:uncharacterized protein BP5553_07768 [Venustampulla echinocandica]RDL34640.1 hypothetical protein BP5553_07768 [Venustampulla echinocandica]